MRREERGARSAGFLFALLMALCSPCAAAADSFTFDDIDFWVGEGTNRAALAIDWVEGATEPPALVWGFRWNGAAKGADMLMAILEADDRLFAKLGGSPGSPTLVYGLGYDADDDGQFQLDDETEFDESGIAFTNAPFFPTAASDEDDYYAEGWFFGFWHYGVADSSPFDGGTWLDPEDGIATRMLADGAWDSWAFENSTMPPFTTFAENPQAAAPGQLPGDYNGDKTVDEEDYVLWRSTFGSMELLDADGNDDGIVDAADYTIWRDHFGTIMNVAVGQTSHVPEPSAAALLVCALFITRLLVRGIPRTDVDCF
jgi:hypothetical protein